MELWCPPVPHGTQTGTHLKGSTSTQAKTGSSSGSCWHPLPNCCLSVNLVRQRVGFLSRSLDPLPTTSVTASGGLHGVTCPSWGLPVLAERCCLCGVPCAREMGRRQVATGVPEVHQVLPSPVGDKAGIVVAFLGCHQQLRLCSPSWRTGMASKSSLHTFHCWALGFSPPLMQNSVETPSHLPSSFKEWGGVGRCGLLCGALGGREP